jgi:5'-nucleotidase / UDP-sugar diphosphatase
MKLTRTAFALITASFIVIFSTASFAAPKHITILHFNDLHGHLEAEDADGQKMGGAARIATVVHKIEAENSARGWETLILFGGDALTGTLISSQFQGAAEFDFLNILGVDAFVIGNHEFDNRIPRLQELISKAKFPIVSANIYWKKSGESFTPASTIIDADGTDVAIIGLTTETTYTSTSPENVTDIKFTDAIKEAKKEVRDLKGKATLKLALTHQGVRRDIKLAKKVRGLSAVIGGHDHVEPDEYCRTVRSIPVCQTPPHGHYIGRLDFEVDGTDIEYLGSELIPITSEIRQDPKIRKMVSGYSQRLGKRFNRVVGSSAVDLYPSRTGRTRLGTFVAESVQWRTESEVALINSGSVRAPIKRGQIRLRDVMAVQPFDNRLVKFSATGQDIRKALDHGIKRGGGAFPQTAGISFDVEGKRAKNIRINNAPIDIKRTYTVGSTDFLLTGGDGYNMLKGLSGQKQLDINPADALADYIRLKRVIRP